MRPMVLHLVAPHWSGIHAFEFKQYRYSKLEKFASPAFPRDASSRRQARLRNFESLSPRFLCAPRIPFLLVDSLVVEVRSSVQRSERKAHSQPRIGIESHRIVVY